MTEYERSCGLIACAADRKRLGEAEQLLFEAERILVEKELGHSDEYWLGRINGFNVDSIMAREKACKH